MKDHIFASWREEYIRGPKEEGCVFCRIASEDDKDKENFVLYRGPQCYIVLNRYPYTSGHLMVVPYRHLAEFTALTASELTEMMSLAQDSVSYLAKQFSPQGFNVGMNLGQSAGAGIEEHLHLHVVPRWTGDSSFVSTIGQTRVVSIATDRVYDELKSSFR